MNILAIGDLHGKNLWYDIIDEFCKYNELDKIVFIGDYLDSHYINDNVQFTNLYNIIEFKKDNKDTVELLLGNHDVHYLYEPDESVKHKASGFNEQMYFSYHTILNDHKDLFSIAYQYDNHLFTHAGLSRGWFNHSYKQSGTYKNIAGSLNSEFLLGNQNINDCSVIRGGKQKTGGPLWADKIETYKKPLEGIHQIMGHSSCKEIKTYLKSPDTSITYIDTLDNYKSGSNLLNYGYLLTL